MSNRNPYEDSPQLVPESGLHPTIPQPYSTVPSSTPQFHPPTNIHNVVPAEKPKRSIGGLKPWTFWSIIILISLVVIGASVGGAIGGSKALKGSDNNNNNSQQEEAQGTTSSSIIGDASNTARAPSTPAATGPQSPQSPPQTSSSPSDFKSSTGCPSSNGTTYTTKFQDRYLTTCSADTNGTILAEAEVVNYVACLTMCSHHNYLNTEAGNRCSAVTFNSVGSCWVKDGTTLVNVGVDENLVSAVLA